MDPLSELEAQLLPDAVGGPGPVAGKARSCCLPGVAGEVVRAPGVALGTAAAIEAVDDDDLDYVRPDANLDGFCDTVIYNAD